MQYDGFTELVEQAAGIDREAAERAVRAVLETLGERLGAREARVLADHLPPELREWLDAAPDAQPFGMDEFVRRVAERDRVDPLTAERHATAVFTVLGQATGGAAYRLMLAHLPASVDELVLAVADRAHADVFDAERAIEAVLESMAECLGGEPFLAGVAERAHVSPARARQLADATLATLREKGIPERYWATLIRSG